MKQYDFPISLSFGPGDSAESILTYSLTDEEAAILEKACKGSLHYDELSSKDGISDLYERLFKSACDQIREELRADDPYLEEYAFDCDEEDFDPEEWDPSDDYIVQVFVPFCLCDD